MKRWNYIYKYSFKDYFKYFYNLKIIWSTYNFKNGIVNFLLKLLILWQVTLRFRSFSVARDVGLMGLDNFDKVVNLNLWILPALISLLWSWWSNGRVLVFSSSALRMKSLKSGQIHKFRVFVSLKSSLELRSILMTIDHTHQP